MKIYHNWKPLFSEILGLWLAVVACVVRWPISNTLLNDIWLACFTWMYNWNYWHKHRGFMVNSILWSFRPESTRTFSLVHSIFNQFAPLSYSSQIDPQYFSHLLHVLIKRIKSNCYGWWTLLTVKKSPLSKKFDVAYGVDRAGCRISERTVRFKQF